MESLHLRYCLVDSWINADPCKGTYYDAKKIISSNIQLAIGKQLYWETSNLRLVYLPNNCLLLKIKDILYPKSPNFIHTKGRHFDNLMTWLVRLGSTVVTRGNPW